jgi:spermidine synthase
MFSLVLLLYGNQIKIQGGKMNKLFVIVLSVFLFFVLAYFGNYNIQQMHSGGFYRTHPEIETMGDIVYYEEGLYATVSVRELSSEGYPTKAYSLFINGKGQGSYVIRDLRVNLLLAYLPLMLKPETKNALVIGLGTGTTSGQISQVTKTTTIEIEPRIVETIPYFNVFNLNVLENPNHNLIIGDGRNYLLRNTEKYDLIIPEPSDPWQSFSTALFSKEFFDLASEDLNEGGLYMQWVSIYQMSPEDFKNFYKTFNSVFPNNIAFVNIKPDEDISVRLETSEIILIGSKKKIELNEEIINNNYNLLPEISKQYLDAISLSSGDEIYHLLLFTSEQMNDYANDAQLVTDDNLILEFSTAKNVFVQKPKKVIEDIEEFIKG